MYNFELEKIVEVIEQEGYSRVMLQLPEGLRDYATDIVGEMERRTQAKAIISSNPCYGACDLADSEASAMGAQALFHFGHSKLLSRSEVPVHYVEVRFEQGFEDILEENLSRLPSPVGVLTTVQHRHKLDEVRAYLEGRGITALVGEGRGRSRYAGQVLGCSFSPAKAIADRVEAFLYLGTGDFHPLGVTLATGKPVFALDPLLREMRGMEEKKESFLRRRYASVAKAKDAKSFGVVVGEKMGQRRLKLAMKIKEKLEEKGREAYLISAREITPENFIYFRRLGALVNTACPRIAIEDSARFPQPVLTPEELEIVLGEREGYKMDEFLGG